MGLSDFYGIKYKLDKSEKFDEFMEALGVSLVTRKMGNAVSPVIELTESNGEYTLSSSSTFKNTVVKFKLGEEFDEETADGRKVKSTITLEGDNKLIHVSKSDKESKIVREFSKEEVVMTLTVDNIVCTRIYKAVS
ncbi:fatty acid-binding protein, muscle [Halyomorpha halys]|uniref:fatty acid-binding protein, muscle n=1 Tax=Halyomorpha halys TaxID=286706 RepID=UPI0006D4D633|nr:fatty acid-binding protein, muscle-like [Halyomorpha halys]